jgi:predicted permease
MRDFRLAVRTLLATPIVTTVAVLSLALGIGANTAIFSLVDSLILRALPVKEPQRLALVTDDSSKGINAWTNPIWEQLRARRGAFDEAFAWSTQRFNLASGGETQFVDGIWASGRMFETLGVPAMLGRTFTEADDRRGGGPDGPVAVISYGFWQRRFAGSADAVGRTLMLERIPFTVVGVTPPDFFGPDVGRQFDVAIPIGVEPLIRGANESSLDQRSWWWLTVMVRLKPEQSLDAGTAALRGLQPQIRDATLPDWRPSDLERYLKEPFTLVAAATGDSSLRQRYRQPLITILVVVALVLLIACANIANLLLARAAARRHEWSVRLALGASRWRLVRLLLAESILLSTAGAGIGLLLAQWGSRLLVRQLSTQTNRVFLDLTLDWRVLAFTTAVAVATALLFGTAPAFRAAEVAPMEAIKEHGRATTGSARFGLANLLVVAQVALSVVLVVAAGLFLRTFSSLANLRLGFDQDRVLIATVNSQRTDIPPADRIATYEQIRERVSSLPGVAAAGVSFITPVSGMTWNNRIAVSGGIELPQRQRLSNFNAVTPGWLSSFGTKILAGRDVSEADRGATARVALVNQAFAVKFLGGANPIGHTVQVDPGGRKDQAPLEIVGLVADAVYRSVREPIPPTIYVPLEQFDELRPPTSVGVSVRATAGSPALLARSVASAVADVNPDLALTFRPLADQVNASLTQERIVAVLAGFFGALAMLLAGLGLYGITSYAVSRRRTEIGIRMALGAPPRGVIRLILSRVGVLVAAGIVVGTGVSLWASKFVATLLYGLEPRDPTTLAGAALMLAAIGGAAGWLPAWRASRIDPAEVLREG